MVVLGGGGVTCGRWEWRLWVAVFSVARGWVVGGGMQDGLLPWFHLRCHALLTRPPPFSLFHLRPACQLFPLSLVFCPGWCCCIRKQRSRGVSLSRQRPSARKLACTWTSTSPYGTRALIAGRIGLEFCVCGYA